MKTKPRAIIAEHLSKKYDRRYILVDPETGEILDDAQGYGYKSIKNAYASWGYKNMSDDRKKHRKKIMTWLDKNTVFVENVFDMEYYAAKDGYDIDADDIDRLAQELKLDLPCSPGEMLRALKWKR